MLKWPQNGAQNAPKIDHKSTKGGPKSTPELRRLQFGCPGPHLGGPGRPQGLTLEAQGTILEAQGIILDQKSPIYSRNVDKFCPKEWRA